MVSSRYAYSSLIHSAFGISSYTEALDDHALLVYALAAGDTRLPQVLRDVKADELSCVLQQHEDSGSESCCVIPSV